MKKLFCKILILFDNIHKTFNSKSGINQRKKKQYLKYIFKNNIPIGKSQDQILEILGNDPLIYSNGTWVYEIDMNRAGSKKLQFQIYFDKHQIVSHFIVRKKRKIKKRL
ncbi:hypothetical protein [Chryseobacterium culicis]|uniref:Lipoprotein SmpA/OmlA domain-containing protein n=1 Tax=Chryseobacterium culicis TaxID=680127 RepID=A0A1H6H6T6_CHRCI|nr:hypothetical protein [Chryseobacterium culicis]SEH29788.1 hypothetical protein SAMN05421593_1181 [Chryseobacterium culicis]